MARTRSLKSDLDEDGAFSGLQRTPAFKECFSIAGGDSRFLLQVRLPSHFQMYVRGSKTDQVGLQTLLARPKTRQHPEINCINPDLTADRAPLSRIQPPYSP